MLRVCYDRATSPASFDFVSFALWAEARRIQHNEDTIEIVFARGPRGGFRNDNLWPHSVDERQRLFDAVVLPMAAMLPSCTSLQVLDDTETRRERAAGKGQRCYGTDVYVRALAQAGRLLRPKTEREPDPHLVTITLRECEHWPERNSVILEWCKAAESIAALGYKVIFVRDTAQAASAIGLFPINIEAAAELEARAALYRSAFCNLFVSNGPAWFALALDASVLMLKPTTESLGRCYTADYHAQCGLPKDGQLPNCPSHQRIVWQDDKASIIIRSFEEFVLAQSREREVF